MVLSSGEHVLTTGVKKFTSIVERRGGGSRWYFGFFSEEKAKTLPRKLYCIFLMAKLKNSKGQRPYLAPRGLIFDANIDF